MLIRLYIIATLVTKESIGICHEEGFALEWPELNRGFYIWGVTMRRCQGVTLIELLVCVALLAIITCIGVPSFKNFFEEEKQSTTQTDLLSAIATAKVEAIRRSAPVYLCTSADGVSCNAAASWQSGWLLCADANRDLSCQSSEILLKSSNTRTASIRVTNGAAVNPTALTQVTFYSNGLVGRAKFSVCSTVADSYNKSFDLNPLGNVVLGNNANASCT